MRQAFKEEALIEIVGDSGDAGLAILEIRKLDPDVVILDIRMPGGGGMPVLEDLKRRTPDRIAIILTTFANKEYREAYLTAGADYFFDKTTDIVEMIDLLVKMASEEELVIG